MRSVATQSAIPFISDTEAYADNAASTAQAAAEAHADTGDATNLARIKNIAVMPNADTLGFADVLNGDKPGIAFIDDSMTLTGNYTVSAWKLLMCDGDGSIAFDATGSFQKYMDTSNNAFLMHNQITFTGDAASTVQLSQPGSETKFFGNAVDGLLTSAEENVSHVWEMGNANLFTFWSIANKYTNIGRIIHKANADTTTQRVINFAFDYVRNSSVEAFAFNTPNGTMRHIGMFGVVYENISGFTTDHFIGSAKGENLRAIGCSSWGQHTGFFHVEEGTTLFSCLGNTANMGEATTFFYTGDNNVSGSYLTPSIGAVVGNAARNGGTRYTNSTAIDFTNDASGTHPGEYIVVSANSFENWDRGIRTAEYACLNLISGNIITNVNEGAQMSRPSLMVRDNLFSNFTALFDGQTEGIAGKALIGISTTTWNGTANLINFGSGTHGFVGFDLEVDEFDLTSGSADWKLFDDGLVIFDETYVNIAIRGSTHYRYMRGKLKFDGTTVTWTELDEYGSGSIDLVDIRLSGGSICLRINNASGATINDSRLQITMDGLFRLT